MSINVLDGHESRIHLVQLTHSDAPSSMATRPLSAPFIGAPTTSDRAYRRSFSSCRCQCGEMRKVVTSDDLRRCRPRLRSTVPLG